MNPFAQWQANYDNAAPYDPPYHCEAKKKTCMCAEEGIEDCDCITDVYIEEFDDYEYP